MRSNSNSAWSNAKVTLVAISKTGVGPGIKIDWKRSTINEAIGWVYDKR